MKSYSIFANTMVDLPWTEVDKAIKEGAIVILPTGVIEEHGPHLPLGVDTYLSCKLSNLVKSELEARGIKTLISPPFYWGINVATGAFPGSFNVRKQTMKELIYDLLTSLKRWGISYVFNINWHEDFHHVSTLLAAIQEARIETGIRAYTVVSDTLANRLGVSEREDPVLIYKRPLPQKASPQYLDVHAGAGETGMMACYFPELVDQDLAQTLQPTELSLEQFAVWRKGWNDAFKLTPSGYLGNPKDFNPDQGKRALEGLGKIIAGLIGDFLQD